MNEIKKLSVNQIVILILLFLGSMNFKLMYFYFIFLAFLVTLILKPKVKMDYSFFVLCVFSICYALFYPDAREAVTSVIRQFSYPICYFLGFNFIRETDKLSENTTVEAEKQIRLAVSVVAMGAFVHYLLNMGLNIGSIDRNSIDIWTGRPLSATGQASLAIMAIVIFAVSIFSAESLFKRVSSFIGIGLILAYNLILAGRTIFVFSAIIFLVVFLFQVAFGNRKNKYRTIFYTLLAIGVGVYIYSSNLFGIKELVLESNFFSRFESMEMFEDKRTYLKLQYLSNLYAYPFGGGHIYQKVGNYAHDLFLDLYNDAGIVCLLLFILFFAAVIIHLFQILRRKDLTQSFKLLVLCMNLTLLMMFCLEPIWAGMPWMLCSFCFYQGMFVRFSKSVREHRS